MMPYKSTNNSSEDPGMPVDIKFEQFRFSQPTYIRPEDSSLYGCDAANAFISRSNHLLREIARVGWDLPDVDVSIDHYGRGTNVFRTCRKVSFDVVTASGETERATIKFGMQSGRQRAGYYRMGCASAFGCAGSEAELHEKSGDWQKKDFWQEAVNLIEPMITRLEALPSKPGHDDGHHEGNLSLRTLCASEPKPAPADFPTLYVWVENNEARNALGFATDDREAEHAMEADYRLAGNGWRFSNGDNGVAFSDLPPHAHDGFDYGSPDPSVKAHGVNMGIGSAMFPVEVKLNSLHDIYVADMALFEDALEEGIARAKVEGRDGWLPGEYGTFQKKTVETFIPASDYKGDYRKPVFMIGRQLGADEARGLAGPVSVVLEGGSVRALLTDRQSGLVMVLHEGEDRLYEMKRCVGAATEVGRILNTTPKVDRKITERIEAHHAKLREEYKNDATMSAIIP